MTLLKIAFLQYYIVPVLNHRIVKGSYDMHYDTMVHCVMQDYNVV